jgi:hypothetical protein
MIKLKNFARLTALAACLGALCAAAPASAQAVKSVDATRAGAQAQWGTYQRMFAADAPWNSRPVKPMLGSATVPKSSYFPTVASGGYSTGVFLASKTDGPVTIYGRDGVSGVWNPDAEESRVITLPRWPAGVLPAAGTDGHADVVDPVTGIIHSFWQLRKVNGKWVAALYAWSPLAGRGWADPAHYYQGARAVGIPASAGLIRKHEVDDGQATYKHALAMSLTFNGLSPSPSYVFPATSADTDASANYGPIPEGSLLMLPSNYDTSKISNLALRKVAETLKVYGAYVVDRNHGTPFVIYVENGSNFNLMPKGWDNKVASDLDGIRGALRPVVSASSWVDGNGRPTVFQKSFNALSMRGPWSSAPVKPQFDSWRQRLVFPATTSVVRATNTNGRGLGGVAWAKLQVGTTQKFTVSAEGGATLRMQVYSGDKVAFDTGDLRDKEFVHFPWPTGAWVVLIARSGVGAGSSVAAELIAVP